MFGILLVAGSSLLLELSSSFVKTKGLQKELGVYTFGFLMTLSMPLLFLATGMLQNDFHFAYASLPTILLRIALEMAAVPIAVKAIVATERSTHTMVRTITIPLLLAIDLILGYVIANRQMIGMTIILIAIIGIFACKKLKKDGVGLTMLSAIIAAATITLYKYDITNYNSVATEQLIVMTTLAIYFFIVAIIYEGNPFPHLKKLPYVLQSSAYGISGALESVAYTFAPASIIVTALRAMGALWSIIAGKVYFHEQHLYLRIIFSITILIGIMLLA